MTARSRECATVSYPSSACNIIPKRRPGRMMPAIFSPSSLVSLRSGAARLTIDRQAVRADAAVMYSTTDKVPKFIKLAVTLAFTAALVAAPLALAAEQGKENLDAAATKEVTGEIVDMMCY